MVREIRRDSLGGDTSAELMIHARQSQLCENLGGSKCEGLNKESALCFQETKGQRGWRLGDKVSVAGGGTNDWLSSNIVMCYRQEEKGMTEDEMAGWHYRLDRHEFE